MFSMETEASSFETSEMLASFLASTSLLSDSWSLCNLANANSPQGFVTQQIGSVGYVVFSGVQLVSGSDRSCRKLVRLDSDDDLFGPLNSSNDEEEKEPPMVHFGLMQIFLSFYHNPSFRQQMSAIIKKSKSIVVTGHSIGGAAASICALWLLSDLQNISSKIQVLCITFGSPLLGNESLLHAILRERWGGNFCHVVSKFDIMPRLLFASLPDYFIPQIHSLLQFWHTTLTSPHLVPLVAAQLHDEGNTGIFRFVVNSLHELAEAEEGRMRSLFWPFGNYLFCSEEGAICVDNATSVATMMHLLFMTGSPSCSIEDHLRYGYYVEKVSSQLFIKRSCIEGKLPESSYEAGVTLALQSSGIICQEQVARKAKDCLKVARWMGRTPNLNCANLAIKLSKINPYRAEIEWYKATCDRSDDQLGYYDSFKQRGASKRDSKINMNRHKLAKFWDHVINMLETNQLPHDFHRRAKWVNGSQFYMLLVEPLDIAEYYRTRRTGMHYISHGRERRYKIFEKWWKERPVENKGMKNKRSKFASLTQDTCFWAKVEEARECLDCVRSERRNLTLLWNKIEEFAKYARGLIDKKEVSKDVVAKNSSYSIWVRDYEQLKSQVATLQPHFTTLMDGETVP